MSQIVPYHMTHHAEPEAVDLLLEVEALDKLAAHVDAGNYGRTAAYLTSLTPYLSEPDDATVLRTAHGIYMKVRASASVLLVFGMLSLVLRCPIRPRVLAQRTV